MSMKMTMAAVAGLMSLVGTGAATPALATTIDFSGAGSTNFEVVSQSYGDSAEADLSYRSLDGGNNWGQTATQSFDHVDYWAQANFSHDYAIFAASGTSKLELDLNAGSGLDFTSVAFNLGSYPDATQVGAFRLYDAGWNLLLSSDTLVIDGAAGALISLAVNTTALHFQSGNNYNIGLQSVSFQTASVATTPIPAALPLFATALGAMGFAARRRRNTAAPQGV